jgi:hypothetical protein
MFLTKCRLKFNGLHGVVSQKIEFFTSAAVTSDPASFILDHNWYENKYFSALPEDCN